MANYKHLSFRERWQVMNKKTRMWLLFSLAIPCFIVLAVQKTAEFISENCQKILRYFDKAIQRQ